MSVQLKIRVASKSADGKVITLVDSTGDYDPDLNPGGYGGPESDPSNYALLRTKYAEDQNWKSSIQLSYLNMITGYDFDSIRFGLSPVRTIIPDGVLQFQYLRGYKNSAKTALAGDDLQSIKFGNYSTEDFEDISYISFESDPYTLYEIFLQDNTILLNEEYVTGAPLKLILWTYGEVFELINFYHTRALDKEIANVCPEEMPDEEVLRLSRMMLRAQAAVVNFDTGEFVSADRFAKQLWSYYKVKETSHAEQL